MIDHLAWAERYRERAAKCRSTAKQVTSAGFRNCYGSLADHYIVLANLEEDFARRAASMQQAANEARIDMNISKLPELSPSK